MTQNKPLSFIEELTLKVAVFIASKDHMITAFLQQTGTTIDTLKETLATPDTQASLLDFILEQDSVLLSFCDSSPYEPDDVWHCRKQLPGFNIWDSI